MATGRRLVAITATLVMSLLLAAPAQASWMHWPVERGTSSGAWITQGFYGDYITYCGARGGCGTHNGYDYGIGVGTRLYAVAPGVVDAVHATDSWSSAYGTAGKWVRIRHDGTTVSGLSGTYYVAYLHMSRIDVSVGQVVGTQTVVGLSGATGGVAAHLHLHVSTSGTFCAGAVDPGCPDAAHLNGSVIPGFAGAPGCQGRCESVPVMWVSPARYGGESYSGSSACGALTYAGECQGTTLRWCENGAIQTVNCADSGQICGHQNADIGNNCMNCDELAQAGAPRCEGSRWLRCDGGQAVATDCAATGQTCTAQGCVGGCEGLDYAGECQGDTLRWCEDNAVKTVNCADSGQICGHQNADIGNNCMNCDELAQAGAPRCEGSRWLHCAGGQAVATDCGASGQTCGVSGCEGSCGGLDYAGECVGDTLRWCEGGTLMEVDCLATPEPQVCGFHNDTIGFNCLTCAELAEAGSPRCEAGRWLHCDGAAPAATACAARGQTCEAATGCGTPVEPEPCKDLDARGLCDGDVALRCVDGQRLEDDCAATGALCVYDSDQDAHRCLGCDALAEPRCDGARWVRCEDGAVVATDCAASALLCDATLGCVEPVGLTDAPSAGDVVRPDTALPDTLDATDTSTADAMVPGLDPVDDGCGCRVTRASDTSSGGAWLGALALLALGWLRRSLAGVGRGRCPQR